MTIDVSITGRNGVVIPEHFKDRIEDKLERATKYDPSILNVDIILKSYKNPRRADNDSMVEITAQGAGHIARAEASSNNFYSALEDAIEKLERSLSKVKTKRKIAKQGHRVPLSIDEAALELSEMVANINTDPGEDTEQDEHYEDIYEPGHVVRSKKVDDEPMSVDDALSNMELVGHDFYLFINSENNKPSVVYRRHAFDYGLLTIDSDA